MKFFILFLAFGLSGFASEQKISLEYCICPINAGEKPALEVHLTFCGSEEGMTEILLPSSWAGQEELYTEISQLRSLSPQVTIEPTEQPQRKRVYHLPHEMVHISYQVSSREKQETEWYYRPLINQTNFFFFGHSFFILPKIDDQAMAHVSIHWHDFPANWNLANSFGIQQTVQEIDISLAMLQQAVYVGGDFQIFSCAGKEAPVFVAMREGWSFSQERLLQLIETVVESHRQFWEDFDFPYYLITILSTEDDPHMGGTGMFNAFSIFMGDFSGEHEGDWKWLAWLLGHEHFHTWNGIKMMSDLPEGSLFWFTEGFTEYYAVKLNKKSGLIDIYDHLNHVNDILYDYYVSSAHNANNERIEQDFWKNGDVQRLPYVRGFLLALRWDRLMQEASGGRYCLDDFMRALFKRTKEKGTPFSREDIQLAASQFLPIQAVDEDIERYIMQGETLVPSDKDFGGIYSLQWREHVGFQVEQTVLKRKVKGVKRGSRAFEAGLRNGQKFLDYRCIDQIVTVVIIDQEGNPKEIAYEKEPFAKLIPQYIFPINNALKNELLRMKEVDQKARLQLTNSKTFEEDLWKDIQEIDIKHGQRLKEIITQYGWPAASLIGLDGSSAMWLLVQHQDQDVHFQKECLELLKTAVQICEASPRSLAYLTDRVKMNEGQPQIYGTQWVQKDGKYVLYLVEDIEHLNERRLEADLGTIEEYKQQMQIAYQLSDEDFRVCLQFKLLSILGLF